MELVINQRGCVAEMPFIKSKQAKNAEKPNSISVAPCGERRDAFHFLKKTNLQKNMFMFEERYIHHALKTNPYFLSQIKEL